jgi:hypothetical protein
MKRKHKKFFLIIWLLSFFIFPSPKTFAYYQPEWLQDYTSGAFNLPNVYFGVGFAPFNGSSPDFDVMRLAKDRALNELCYQISVSIKSQFEEHLSQKANYAEENVSSSLFVSTRKEFSGIREKERWTDLPQHRHWVLLVIDQATADRQVEQQNFINEVVDRLDHKQDEILNGVQTMTKVLNQKMKMFEDRVNHLVNLAETINTKVEKASSQTKIEYVSLKSEIQRLENMLRTEREEHGMQINELVHQNQIIQNLLTQINERIQSDYFLAFSNSDVKPKKDNDGFSVRIEPLRGQGADYYKGEKIKFRVSASRECFIKVIYLSSSGENSGIKKMINTILFPNKHDKNNWINAGETKIIGQKGELEIVPPFGKDVVTVVASTRQFTDLDDILKRSANGYYSKVTSNTRGAIKFRSRGIVVVEPESISPSVATDTCFIVIHSR